MTLPNAEAVSRNLRDLFSKPVTVKVGQALPSASLAFVAVYVDPAGTPVALGLSDIRFAAYSGAALAMIPVAVAAESVKKNKLEENLRENFYEVINILAAVMNASSEAHLKLGELAGPAQAPEAAKAIIAKPGKRVDFDVTVEGFGAGKLGFLVSPTWR